MSLKTLGAKAAAALDQELMSTCAFSIDQLMELAGLSVSQAGEKRPPNSTQTFAALGVDADVDNIRSNLSPVTRLQPLDKGRRILVACGPGNNGGDGLVAARHLYHYGYKPTIFYPKKSKNDLYQRLTKQLEELVVPFVDDFQSALKSTDHIVDAIFGFSFSGEVREPFPGVIKLLETTKLPVTSVDAPSSWHIEDGPPESGLGSSFMPTALVSLTAPKPLVKYFKGRHFVGGRFVAPSMARKYDIDVPEYVGVDQVVEILTNTERL